MKLLKILLLVSLYISSPLLASVTSSADTIEWMINIEEAKEFAKDQKKPILLFIHSRDCYYCPVMKESVFTDKGLRKKLEENFILVSLDGGTGSDSIEEDASDQAPDRYITSVTPAYFFMGPDEEMLARKGKKAMVLYGYWSIKDFSEWADDALRRFNKLYKAKYAKDAK